MDPPTRNTISEQALQPSSQNGAILGYMRTTGTTTRTRVVCYLYEYECCLRVRVLFRFEYSTSTVVMHKYLNKMLVLPLFCTLLHLLYMMPPQLLRCCCTIEQHPRGRGNQTQSHAGMIIWITENEAVCSVLELSLCPRRITVGAFNEAGVFIPGSVQGAII